MRCSIAELRGPVNLTAPVPVTNAEFTRALGRVLGRPTLFPVPAAALRLALGAMADELLLASIRVIPERLRASGYEFRNPDLAGALRHVLGEIGPERGQASRAAEDRGDREQSPC